MNININVSYIDIHITRHIKNRYWLKTAFDYLKLSRKMHSWNHNAYQNKKIMRKYTFNMKLLNISDINLKISEL